MTARQIRGALSLPAIAVLAIAASPALAGTATVYQCQGPGGQLAATDMLRVPDVSRLSVGLHCDAPSWPWGIELRRGASGNWDPANNGELTVTGPPGTFIAGGQIERQMGGYVYNRSQPETWAFGYRLATADGTVVEQCGTVWGLEYGPRPCVPASTGTWQFPTTTADLPTTPSALLRLSLGCYAYGNSCQRTSDAELLGIRRMALRVTDVEAPTVRSAVGPVAGDQPVRTRTISINASDTGLGLYRLVVILDGQVSETRPFDPSAGGCRDVNPATADPYEFGSASACPTASTTRSFSLASLPSNGQHEIRIDVEDASGNRTTAVDRVTTFDLPPDGLRCPTGGCVRAAPVPNGANASGDVKLTATVRGRGRVRLAYSRRATLTGRVVTGSGSAIGGALIDVSDHPAGTSELRPAGQVRTDASGRFRYTAPAGASRDVIFEYRTHIGDAAAIANAQIAIRVRAGVTMTLRPNTVRPGGSVRVRGRLLGSGIGAGTLVEVQALDGREWRTFKTLPVRRGRFAYRYRFRHTSGAARFLWRIYARAQAGLPYDAGASKPAWVVVRP